MKKILSPLIVLLCLFSVKAHCREPEATGHELAGNLLAYPYVDTAPPALTPAPEGYVPFHMEHYGRHGSRWLIGAEDYSEPVEKLAKAERAGLLTPLGRETLDALRLIQKQSEGRLGELSDKGAIQHQTIGQRMAQNFPEIFIPQATLSAKSTPVVRCIISMANALEGIEREAPGLHFDKDASMADMWFMNYDDKEAWVVKDSVSALLLTPYRDNLMRDDSYLLRLVSDETFARDSVAPGLMPRLYWVLGNAQSHTGQPWLFERVFSKEQLVDNWKAGNAGWFVHGGNSAVTRGRMPFVQRNLLRRIIEKTDSAITNPHPSANLRFGHDGILVSLITLMELGGYGDAIDSLDELENSEWRDYDIIPMGGNLQLIFYRKAGSVDAGDVLVKALVNEREVTMPGLSVNGPYYSWGSLREYYEKKLSDFELRNRE